MIINFEAVKAGLTKMEVQNNAYVEAVSRTQFWLLGLKDTVLPPKADFYKVPENYDGLRICYDSIQKECVNFTLTIYEELERYPNLCLRALKEMERYVESSIYEVDKLSSDILTQEEIKRATDHLVSYFDYIIEDADHQIENLNILCSNLEKYRHVNLETLENDFFTLTNELCVDSRNYEAAIKELVKIEETLSDQIKDFKVSVTGSVLLSGAIILGGILSIAAIATSGGAATPLVVGMLIGGIATVGSFCIMGLDSYYLQKAKRELEETITQLNGYERDAIIINSTQLQFSKYVGAMIVLPKTLQTISEAWESVRTGFNEIKNRVIESDVQVTTKEWMKINQLLKECSMLISNQKALLTDLQIQDTKVSKASFEIGMTKEQVQGAAEAAPQGSFKEYMLAI